MIRGRQPGDNITIMNTLFWRGMNNDGDYTDFLDIIYKDCDTGLKYVQEMINPDYEYYIAHEDSRVDYNRLFIEESKVDTITVPYRDLEKDIATRVGLKNYFYENIRNGNRNENRKLHLRSRLTSLSNLPSSS